ncbi:unnamed protein product [Absidia cylindrospora]
MRELFVTGGVDSSSCVTVGIGWAIEQVLGGMTRHALERYNTKVLQTIQSAYDQTDVLRPLLQRNYDMSGLSVTLLCDRMVSTFNISSLYLRASIKVCLFGQCVGLALVKLPCLLLANLFLWLHLLYHHPTRKPSGSWTFDLEWSELTVKMAIRKLRHPGLVGNDLLVVLYQVAQFKSGPLACKLPIDDSVAHDDHPRLAELLVTAFALYHVDGIQVMEHQDIHILGLATVTFERVHPSLSSAVVNLTIDENRCRFSVNATAQCQQDPDGAWHAAYLVQYAIATDNKWLLEASLDCINHIVDVPHIEVLKNMAYAAGCAIALHSGRTYPDIQDNPYWNWIVLTRTSVERLAWCQHDRSSRTCYCWLTRFLIMSPETAAQLYTVDAKRSIIVVATSEDDGADVLRGVRETANAFVRLSSQSQIITNSTQFQRTNRRIIVAGTMQ